MARYVLGAAFVLACWVTERVCGRSVYRCLVSGLLAGYAAVSDARSMSDCSGMMTLGIAHNLYELAFWKSKAAFRCHHGVVVCFLLLQVCRTEWPNMRLYLAPLTFSMATNLFSELRRYDARYTGVYQAVFVGVKVGVMRLVLPCALNDLWDGGASDIDRLTAVVCCCLFATQLVTVLTIVRSLHQHRRVRFLTSSIVYWISPSLAVDGTTARWSAILRWWFGITHRVRHGRLDTSAGVYFANHRSQADFWLDLDTTGHRTHLVGYSKILWIMPFITPWAVYGGSFAAFRKGCGRAEVFRLLDAYRAWSPTKASIVFPEGRRNHERTPLRVKDGMIEYAHKRGFGIQCVITPGKERVFSTLRCDATFGVCLYTTYSKTVRPEDHADYVAFRAAVVSEWKRAWRLAYDAANEDHPPPSRPLPAPRSWPMRNCAWWLTLSGVLLWVLVGAVGYAASAVAWFVAQAPLAAALVCGVCLAAWCRSLARTPKVVLTCGSFDLLHHGHVSVLERARALGDRLVVGVSSDALSAAKGKTSVMAAEHRVRIVRALRCVDEVFVEDSLEAKSDYVRRYGASVFVIGDDWAGKFDGLPCPTMYLPRTEGISSTILRQRTGGTRAALPPPHTAQTEPPVKASMTAKTK